MRGIKLKACMVCGAPSPDVRCPKHQLRDRTITRRQRLRILARDRWVCQECGVALKPGRDADDSAHVGHRVALADGGSDDDRNLYASCRRCNLKRRTATKED